MIVFNCFLITWRIMRRRAHNLMEMIYLNRCFFLTALCGGTHILKFGLCCTQIETIALISFIIIKNIKDKRFGAMNFKYGGDFLLSGYISPFQIL